MSAMPRGLALDPASREPLCPRCRSTTHQCTTGDEGCLHCDNDECGFTWLQCSDGCKGWDVFESNSERGIGPSRFVICRCDECFSSARPRVYDDDFATWPEAQAALAAAVAEVDADWFASIGRAVASSLATESVARNFCPVYRCRCSWLGSDPDVRRNRATCPACAHHDKRRVTVHVDHHVSPAGAA